jgi:hypothetical protein
MVGGGPHAIEVDVVEPRAERLDALFEVVTRDGA